MFTLHISTPSLVNQIRNFETRVFIPTAPTNFSIKSVRSLFSIPNCQANDRKPISTIDMSATVIIPDKHVNHQSSDPANNQIRWMSSKKIGNTALAYTGVERAFFMKYAWVEG